MGSGRLSVLVAIAVLVGVGGGEAAVLCSKKSGVVFLRATTCKAKETPVDAAAVGVQGPPGRGGVDGAPGMDGMDGQPGTPADQSKLPIAFGFVNAAGTLLSGTPNITEVSFNAGLAWYVITISGTNFFFSSYPTIVTATDMPALTPRYGSYLGSLLVQLYDSTNTATAGDFAFVVFHP